MTTTASTATATAPPPPRLDRPDRPRSVPTSPRRRPSWPARLPLPSLLLVMYLLCSLALWWPVWSSHPASTYLCACGDPGQYLWFFAAPAQALLHGHSPLLIGADYHPGGVNMMDNPGVVGLALAAAPITWVFGPVASVNVVLLVTPALSALAGFVALRRWVRWWPAAALGGAFYGFSPYAVSGLEYVHLQTAFLAIPPLVLLCLDELLVRQRHRAVPVGIALGGLLAAQYLVSPEMLVLTVLIGAVGVGLLVADTALRHPDELRRRAPAALRGLGAAVVTSLALVGYPVWFALAGPRHTVGAPWAFIAETGNDIKDFLVPGGAAGRPAADAVLFGYSGDPGPDGNYLGPTVVAAAVCTVVAARRSRLVRWAAAVAVVAAVLSLGIVLITSPSSLVFHHHSGHRHSEWWLPWSFLAHVPLVDEASPGRLAGIIDLFVILVCAIGLDRLVTGLRRRQRARSSTVPTAAGSGTDLPGDGGSQLDAPASDVTSEAATGPAIGAAAGPVLAGPVLADPVLADLPAGDPRAGRSAGRARWGRLLPGTVGLAVAAAVLVPVGLTYEVPLHTTTVQAPLWYRTAGDHLPVGSVVLALPWGLPLTSAWQAMAGMHIVMAGGDAFVPGPGGHVLQKPQRGSANAILTDLSTFASNPEPTAAVEQAVRRALVGWGVTTLVVSRGIGPPAYAVGFLSAVMGALPVVRDGSWVWGDVRHAPAPWVEPTHAMLRCILPLTASPMTVARCVARLARPATGLRPA